MFSNFFSYYFSLDLCSFNDIGELFYFTDPGCVFFTNLIFFHDEVCFFSVWILVFTYWMLYSILIDHIYYIKPSKFNVVDPNCTYVDVIMTFYNSWYSSIISFYSLILNNLSIEPSNYYYNNFFFWVINNFFNIIKNSILYTLGRLSSKNFKNIDDFYFFEEKSIQKSLLNRFDLNSKLLFSGSNSHILSIQGKLLEIEELYSLTNFSTDYNILILNKISHIYTTNNDDPNACVIRNVFPFRYNQLSNQFNDDFLFTYKSNYIFNININLQETFFYNRRLSQMSYFFNPYIEIFNDIFSLNDNNHYILSFKEPGQYKWWEFKYLYIMTRAHVDYINLSNFSRGVNRDIVIDSWEYHHSISFEYIWALFPTLVILSIIGPSFILLFSSLNFNDAFLSVKVIGHQWYWSYELSPGDNSDDSIKFDSRIILLEDSPLPQPLPASNYHRLLNVDQRLILVAHKPINFLITSGDVLHSFAIPSFGIKVDAVPGRINTFYLEGSKVGRYYGQCSELCGFGHGFMPIVVEVVKHNDILVEYF